MDPNIRTGTSKTGTAGAGQAAEEQSMSPQTNVNKATGKAGANRGSAQKQGVSLSGAAGQSGQQTGRRRTNSS